MPIYEYCCADCGQEFQKLVYGESRVTCPACQSPTVRRTLSLFGVGSSSRMVASEGAVSAACCSPGACSCR